MTSMPTEPEATLYNTQVESDTASHDTPTPIQHILADQTAMQHIVTKAEQPLHTAATLIEQILSNIDPRIRAQEGKTLNFCLQELLSGIDALSRVARRTFNEERFASQSPSSFIWKLEQRRTAWTYLRDMKYVLERLELHCQLLNDASRASLAVLDTSPPEDVETVQAIPTEPDISFVIHLYCEQFQDALTPVLDSWLQCLSEPYTFSCRFAYLLSSASTLTLLDKALSTLIKSASSLYRDTLPALSIAEQDEVAAHFLDLMQKVDQILQQSDAMIEPLHTLIKQFAPGDNML